MDRKLEDMTYDNILLVYNYCRGYSPMVETVSGGIFSCSVVSPCCCTVNTSSIHCYIYIHPETLTLHLRRRRRVTIMVSGQGTYLQLFGYEVPQSNLHLLLSCVARHIQHLSAHTHTHTHTFPTADMLLYVCSRKLCLYLHPVQQSRRDGGRRVGCGYEQNFGQVERQTQIADTVCQGSNITFKCMYIIIIILYTYIIQLK